MKFKVDEIPKFKSIFEANKNAIRNFSGCSFLELYQDKKDETIFFTYSYWEKETDLETYRNSSLFKSVWSKTKILFSDKPEAWSVEKITSLP